MRLTQALSSLLWKTSISSSYEKKREEYIHLEQEKNDLLERIQQLKTKHIKYLENSNLTPNAKTCSENKIAILNFCACFLSNEWVSKQDLLDEIKRQKNETVNYTTYDGWWSAIGLGYAWQNTPSATSTVVEDVLKWANKAEPIYEAVGYSFELR